MKEEVKEALKVELKEVQKFKTSILVGIAMVVLDLILVLTSLISIYSIIFILPLVLLIRKQVQEYRIKQLVLMFSRYLVDKEYAQTFNSEENGK